MNLKQVNKTILLPGRAFQTIFMLILIAVLDGGSQAAAQSSTADVFIDPPSVQLGAGQKTDIAVKISNVEGLYAFDVALSFDPGTVRVIDADTGQAGHQVAMGMFMDPGFVIMNTAENDKGVVRFVMTQLNPSEAKNGSGDLIVITLEGIRSGSSPLILNKAQLSNRTGIELSSRLTSGQIEIVATSTNPTSTPKPAQSGGTLLPVNTPLVLAPGMGNTHTPTSQSQSSETELSTPAILPTPTATQPAGEPGVPTAIEATLTATPPELTASPKPKETIPQATETARTPNATISPTKETIPAIAQQASYDLIGETSSEEHSEIASDYAGGQTLKEDTNASKETTPLSFPALLVILAGIAGIGVGFGLALFISRQR